MKQKAKQKHNLKDEKQNAIKTNRTKKTDEVNTRTKA